MNKAQNVAIDVGNVYMASGIYTDALHALDNLSVSFREFSLAKTVCPDEEGHYDRTR